ncbi:vacuole effluxer Atg22 like-domain-containing protein [Kalaharituber pfeilii]|nr:vacuole effluxer Atg22 like-domain-containing protein [Kalaharituber pfeilii]
MVRANAPQHHYAYSPLLAPNRSSWYENSDPEDADDERSFSEIDEDDPIYRRQQQRMCQQAAAAGRRSSYMPQFPAQDVRPTSVKELAGWYSYAWAAEAYVVCGVGSFIPVTLEQLARENGVLAGDPSVPCGASNRPGSGMGGDAEQCVVNILGLWISTASFAMYTFSISVFLQSLVIISMSGAADHGSYRKRLLLIFAFMGSLSTMLFITVTPRFFIFSALWAILGNVGFGASFVLLNAFLPVLVRHHTSLLFKSPPPTPLNEGNALLSSTDAGMTYNATESPTNDILNGVVEKANNPALQLSSQISSYGIAIGYCGAVVMQALGIILILATRSTTWSLQLVLTCIGAWWFAFSIPAALWLRPRPGPPLPKLNSNGTVAVVMNGNGNGSARSSGNGRSGSGKGWWWWWTYIAYAWNNLWKTVLRAKRLKDVMLFLAAWFMISDGVATVSGTAILFAKTNLHMGPAAVALISVISTLSGVVGAFTWAKFPPYLGISPAKTILILIIVFEMIPLYGLLGFIPAVKRSGVIGLTHASEMYILGAVYGFVLGGVGSYCRSVFGELIPPGSEAAFYALYAITDKGSSIFGPAIVGVLTDKFGDIRAGFWFLAVLLAAPFPLMMMVDVGRGKAEAEQLAAEEMRRFGILPDGVYEEEGGDSAVEGDHESGRAERTWEGVSEWRVTSDEERRFRSYR